MSSEMRPQIGSAFWAIHKETYDRLKAHSAMDTWKDYIFDEVPQNQGCPYIKVGLSFSDDFGARDISGEDLTHVIDIFSDNRFKSGKKECNEIMNGVLLAMTDPTLGLLDLSSYGFKTILQNIAGKRILEEETEDGVSYHGVIELNYLIQKI